MDKELVRVIIIFVGVMVMAGMIIWGMIKSRRAERESFHNDKYADKYDDDGVDVVPLGSALDDEPFESRHAYAVHDESVEDEGYEGGYSGVGSIAADDHDWKQYMPEATETGSYEEPAYSTKAAPAAVHTPDIIQFGIVSKDLEGFNGMQLAVAFKSAGLSYGNMKIFEYRDATGDAQFSVASIVEPGTFPETDLDQFHCPGIVFFMQPEFLADPVAVFDQLVAVVHKLAKQLDGVEWDHKRKPLTAETVQMLREQLF